MSHYSSSPYNSGSPGRYNSKVVERKHQAQTDWAELVRQQQALAEQLMQQEKEKRMLQRMDLTEALGSMMTEKQYRRMMELEGKHQDYLNSEAGRREYQQYLINAKNEREKFQSAMANEYDREKVQKYDDYRRKVGEEKQIEQKIVYDALDSLERERIMNDIKRADFIKSTEQMLQEKEYQKRREQEQAEMNRQDHIRLMDQNTHNLNMKETRYKQYYQNIDERQKNLQQVYDYRVGQEERTREKQLENLVNKNVEEVRIKNEEEERMRQMRYQEQLKNATDNNKSKINEHEEQTLRERLSYKDKVEEMMRQNEQKKAFDEQVKRYQTTQRMDYKTTLEHQVKEAEDLKWKQHALMLEHEKKMHLEQFEGLIPGLKSSKIDALINPQLRTTKAFYQTRNAQASPVNSASPTFALSVDCDNNSSGYGSPTHQNKSFDAPLRSPTHQNKSFDAPLMSPTSTAGVNVVNQRYNPITNPVPNNIQNPYIVKDIQYGAHMQRNYLAVMADKNLLSTKHTNQRVIN